MSDELPHDREIDWLLNSSMSAIGFRGSDIANVLMSGGPGSMGSGVNPDKMTDLQMRHIATQRRLVDIWNRVPSTHQTTLRAYYESAQHPEGMRAALNKLAGVARLQATDSHLEGACRHLADPKKHKLPAQITKAARDRVTEARKTAIVAVVVAHQAWREARAAHAEDDLNA